MKNYKELIINKNASVLEALRIINNNPKWQTLFVVDNKDQLVGTITDGDIRRGFLKDLNFETPLEKFMLYDFMFMKENEKDFSIMSKARQKGVKLLPVIDHQMKIVKAYDLQRTKTVLPLECVIMAGGRGERLHPLTIKTPKPLLKIGHKPIIEHNIDRLIKFGIEKIYICVNYLGEQIVDYFGDGSSKGISIEYIWEEKPLGTAGALSLIKDFKFNHVLLMNSDLFTNVDFESLYLKVINDKAAMGIASTPYTVNIPYAIFDLEGDNIKSFKEKPNNTHYANAGIYIFEKKYSEMIPKNTFYNITDLIDELILKNKKVIHDPIVGYWIDIGKKDDYNYANEIANHLKNEPI